MGTPSPVVSPWTFYDTADVRGARITATVTFDVSNTLTGATVFRDPTCVYTKVIIGSINPDGTLPAGTRVVTVPAGTTVITKAQLNSQGLVTVADIQGAPQITASP